MTENQLDPARRGRHHRRRLPRRARPPRAVTWRSPTTPKSSSKRPRQRYYRDDAVRWVWIFYGLAQATVTMLIAFDVIETTTVAAVVTVVALIVYVGVNEIFVRPYRSRRRETLNGPSDAPRSPQSDETGSGGTEGADDP